LAIELSVFFRLTASDKLSDENLGQFNIHTWVIDCDIHVVVVGFIITLHTFCQMFAQFQNYIILINVFYIKMIRLLTYFKGLTNSICIRTPASLYRQDNISFYRFSKSIPLERTNIRKAELNRNSGTRVKERILNKFTIPYLFSI